MKLLLNFILLFVLSSVSFSQTLSGKERGDRASLSIRLANYTTETAKTLPVTMMADLESFSTLSLSEKNDVELVKNVLKTLLILDAPESEGGDPSRTAVILLTESYKKHKAVYHSAIKQLEKAKNKKQLKEFLEIFEAR